MAIYKRVAGNLIIENIGAANTVVTINGQTSTGVLTVKSGSNLSYTRIG